MAKENTENPKNDKGDIAGGETDKANIRSRSSPFTLVPGIGLTSPATAFFANASRSPFVNLAYTESDLIGIDDLDSTIVRLKRE